MEIEKTNIEDLKVIHLKNINDNRGSFCKIFNEDFFRENNLRTDFKESYFSVSNKDVIRGMHFQVPPSEHVKLVYVNKGNIVDVVIDLRKSSKTYGKYFSTVISEKEPKVMYIPTGCGHGFLSLEDDTIVSYMQTSTYNKDCDAGVLWNSFGMDWGVKTPVISKRDLLFEKFENFNSPFI